MGERKQEQPKRRVCIGLMAHVDAGKTTLSEQLLYLGGAVRERGRVDHGDAFLDTEPVERERGITVFSGQADFTWGDTVYYLLDTPGHTDFAAETERVLPALDYVVLVVSCAEGVQGHTETLWRLLRDYGVPVFLFLNKLDRPGADLQRTMAELHSRCSPAASEVALRSLSKMSRTSASTTHSAIARPSETHGFHSPS